MARAKRSKTDYQQRYICRDPHKSGFFRVYRDLFADSAFQSMTKNAQILYIAMGIESRGSVSFRFPHSAYRQFMSKDGFEKAKAQLVERGFITEKRYRTVPNEYAFSDRWKQERNMTVRPADKSPP